MAANLPLCVLYQQEQANNNLFLVNERVIPSVVDGLTPIQREILFTAFMSNLDNDISVAELANLVYSNTTKFHKHSHLEETIIGLAQNHVGSKISICWNPTAISAEGSSDHANPQDIFTRLSPVAGRLLWLMESTAAL